MANLAEKTYWKIGGECDFFYQPNNEIELKKTLTESNLTNLIIIGNGTNLLFDSLGYSGSVIKLGNDFDYIKKLDSKNIEVGGATWVPGMVRQLSLMGKGNLDHCIGIPATIGGLVAMNGGSQRRSISENIVSVKVMDYKGNISVIDNLDCQFSYRNSIFLNEKLIILSVILKLNNIIPRSNRTNLLKILKERRTKFPRKKPNCGSVFKSSPELYKKVGPPGYIIESLGLKGFRIGDAMISKMHANFIVNMGCAESSDILSVVAYINDRCFEKYGFRMKAEAIYISESGFRCNLDEFVMSIK
ncbi:UDP-N-acetylmuramate dehydrogenase [Vibrio splendidus]|uniref:UDP-N-acetylmuramate dehydrogenase n=1 Tax=Vibrio splendidus TaxID=29497 RepID=UPI000D343D9C|nr:UDP-N-acetylmuramate dehydrogenase [Vibrio splendidus]PTP48083.1 UDP-N-acetylenolpyruvoylglucosamine reductase [Vibrio splendidus]